jgi:opacity protein-like surface antigen
MKMLLCIGCLMAMSLTASAQDHPKFQVFGGYSYFRAGGETVDLAPTGTPGTGTQKAANLNGFNFSVAANPHSKIGFVADIGGYYGNTDFQISSPVISGSATLDTSYYTFLFGPQISVRGKENKNTFFARPMVGLIRGKVSGSGLGVTSSETQSAFAAGFGAGYDRKLSKNVSLRLFQFDYILSRFDQGGGLGKSTQSNLRISVGFVFH